MAGQAELTVSIAHFQQTWQSIIVMNIVAGGAFHLVVEKHIRSNGGSQPGVRNRGLMKSAISCCKSIGILK